MEMALTRAKIDLYNIIANFAMKDYLQAKGKRKYVGSYSLSHETKTAQEYYAMVYGKTTKDITLEQEEKIKAYLLPFRTSRREFIKETGGQITNRW